MVPRLRRGKLALLVATPDFAERATGTFDYTAPDAATPTPTPAPESEADWRGEYFDNMTLSGAPTLIRRDPAIDFFWETDSPAPEIPADKFSVRWTTRTGFAGGLYRFSILTDDGMRLWIDGQLVIDNWQDSRSVVETADVSLSAGDHDLKVEYYENTLGARARVWWQKQDSSGPTPTWTPQPTDESVLFDDHPRNNLRGQNASFCSGFQTECNFANCPLNYRLVWGAVLPRRRLRLYRARTVQSDVAGQWPSPHGRDRLRRDQ